MKTKLTLLVSALLIFAFGAQAQVVRVLYEIVPHENHHVVKVYLQSTTEKEVVISAANLSLALPASVKATEVKSSSFIESWTDYLQESRTQDGLQLRYEDRDMSRRLQYGNANPNLPATRMLVVPARQDDPLLVMEIHLQGQGAGLAYLEHQSENPLNQLGDQYLQPIDYVIEHPSREGQDTEINPAAINDLVVFPNPSKGKVVIRMDGSWEGAYRYTVSDLLGRVLLEANVPQDLVGKEFSIDLTHWAEGTYLFNLVSANGESMTRKLVKD